MVCRIAVCSDSHSKPLLDDSVAAMLHGGDVYDAAAQGGDAMADASLREWMGLLKTPAFAVRGNHDWEDPLRFFDACEDVSGRIVRLCPGLFLAGVGFAAPRYYDLPGESDLWPQCQQILRQARRLLGSSERIILLTHYPPKGVGLVGEESLGSGWTFDCVRELVAELRTLVVVQGHVHEWFGMMGDICVDRHRLLCVNPGPIGGILEVSIEAGKVAFRPHPKTA